MKAFLAQTYPEMVMLTGYRHSVSTIVYVSIQVSSFTLGVP